MPGSGKSFVGKQLAEHLGFTLIETDKIIEREFNLPLQQVAEKLGNEAFLDKEAETVIKSTYARKNIVVSPGGSVIYRQETMYHLKKLSRVFYLNVPLEILERRVGNVPRGIIITENKTFADLYTERTPIYEASADYVLNGNHDPEVIVKEILSKIDPGDGLSTMTVHG